MAYITVAELEARKDRREVWELANDANLSYEDLQLEENEEALAVARAAIEAAISDGSDHIDDRIGDRFDVPLAAPDGVIKRINADLAMYYLAMRRRLEEPPDLAEARKKCDAALDAYGQDEGAWPPIAGRDETKPFLDTGD